MLHKPLRFYKAALLQERFRLYFTFMFPATFRQVSGLSDPSGVLKKVVL